MEPSNRNDPHGDEYTPGGGISPEMSEYLESLVPRRPKSRDGKFEIISNARGRCRLCDKVGPVAHVETNVTAGNLFSANFCAECAALIVEAAGVAVRAAGEISARRESPAAPADIPNTRPLAPDDPGKSKNGHSKQGFGYE